MKCVIRAGESGQLHKGLKTSLCLTGQERLKQAAHPAHLDVPCPMFLFERRWAISLYKGLLLEMFMCIFSLIQLSSEIAIANANLAVRRVRFQVVK